MIDKIILSIICLFAFLNANNGVFVDKQIYKTYTDKKGKHTIYAENYIFTYKYEDEDKITIDRIKKIKGYLNNTLEWTIESDGYLTKTISKYSVIDDFDKDGIKDVILVYGFTTFGKSKKSDNERYISFDLAIIYKNQVAKITHHSDADDCFRYTEVDELFYTFPQPIIDKTVKMLEKIESEHYIPIPNDFKNQIKSKNKYLWDCRGKRYPWNDDEYGYIDIDGKRKIKLYKYFSSLSNYCKKSGFKESEIRTLNPWINKEATNILPDAEIIIPMLDRRGNYVVK